MSYSKLDLPGWGGWSDDGGDNDARQRLIVDLTDPIARDTALTGGKAAALATAAAAGLRTLPGVILTTAFSRAVDAGTAVANAPVISEAFLRAAGPTAALVARSSSVIEDTVDSSMAGQFDSVLGITTLDELADAVTTVLGSRRRAQATGQPIAVLIQPLIEPAFGGVLFGVDPVTGRTDRLVVSAVRGAPEPLVSGRVSGSRYVLDTSGHVVDADIGDGPKLRTRQLHRLMSLAADVAAVFGAPQDVEWAIGTDGRLWLLQSRPVTSEVRGAPSGPIYGPGPVAETFPEPLTELERDLWVPPLRDAVREAVLLAGIASKKELDTTDVVVTVDGRVAVDLHLAGEVPSHRHNALHPMRAAAQVRSAWRVGRLRAALPRLAAHVLDQADRDLKDVPALDALTPRQLLSVLHRGTSVLRSIHAHEILMGMLLDTGDNAVTGASVALRALADGRADGLDDAAIVEANPVVLALTPPRIGGAVALPADVAYSHTHTPDGDAPNPNGVLREALRLRVRWVQELTGRAAWALGRRLVADGKLATPDAIRHLTLADLDAITAGAAVAVPAPAAGPAPVTSAALPARFQLSDRGKAIEARPPRHRRRAKDTTGTGAGGGRGRGPVTYDAIDPAPGSVLVTTTLTPGLGPLLPRLAGIVAETGSVLSHLAILARESGVPTVVGYVGAAAALPEGAIALVDGDVGKISVERQPEEVAR